jgi:hypothetical protein
LAMLWELGLALVVIAVTATLYSLVTGLLYLLEQE